MIRHRTAETPRRIAVVEVPRSAVNRLGRIGSIRQLPAGAHLGSIREYDWAQVPSLVPMDVEPYAPQQPFTATGTRDMTPRTSSGWMATILQRQANQRESTPGTLTWTPTPTPQPNISARWNSWSGPCADQAMQPTTSTSAGNGDASSSSGEPLPKLVLFAAALGAAASAAYLLNTLLGPRKA
jgi:hypothetical protein